MSDYLFDKAGEADPEVERLEALLAPMAYRGAAPLLPRKRRVAPFVVVAAVAAAAMIAVVLAHPWRPRPPERVRIAIGDIGSVELAPGTKAHLVAPHEMQLDRGTLTAVIHAPPRMFVVRTPRAVVTDLGCAFEVTVDEAGNGRVVVTEGKVGVQRGGEPEVVVAAGARTELTIAAPMPTPTLAPTPTPTPTPTRTPTPTPTKTPVKVPVKTHHHVKATKAVATPKNTTVAPKKNEPKKNDRTKIEHDPLKALQHDVE